MSDKDGESASILALTGKVSRAAYALLIIVGLAALVLVVQRPVVTPEEIVRHTYTEQCVSTVVARHDERVVKLFEESRSEISWPFSEQAERFVAADTIRGKELALLRFLNERNSERERHVLLLLRDPLISESLREYVEDAMGRSGTVTVPVLQSRIASGTFAFSIAVVFVFLHIYLLYHREYLLVSRKRLGRVLTVTPSLLTAPREDYDLLAPRKVLGVIVGQWCTFFLSPFVLALVFATHLYQRWPQVSAYVTVALVLSLSTGVLAMVVWFDWGDFGTDGLFGGKRGRWRNRVLLRTIEKSHATPPTTTP